jgi:hypothetical protein
MVSFPGGGLQNGDALGIPLQMKDKDSGQNFSSPVGVGVGVSVGSQAVEQQTVS